MNRADAPDKTRNHLSQNSYTRHLASQLGKMQRVDAGFTSREMRPVQDEVRANHLCWSACLLGSSGAANDLCIYFRPSTRNYIANNAGARYLMREVGRSRAFIVLQRAKRFWAAAKTSRDRKNVVTPQVVSQLVALPLRLFQSVEQSIDHQRRAPVPAQGSEGGRTPFVPASHGLAPSTCREKRERETRPCCFWCLIPDETVVCIF